MKTFFSALLAASLLVSSGVYVLAEEDLNTKLSNIQEQMQVEKEKTAEAEVRIGSITEQLHQIQQELDAATSELKAIEAQRIATENEIIKNERILKEAEARLAERERILHKRVRDIYINGRLSYLDVIIGAKNFNDFANRVELLKRIIDADIALLDKIKEERALILEKRAALERDKAKIVELQKQAEAKKAVIEQKKQEQQELLARAVSERDAAMQAYKELEATSNEVRAMIQARQQQSGGGSSGGYVQGTGQFIWPGNGPLTSPFGYRIHPIFGTSILHAGIDIGVDEGSHVFAADSGYVSYAGWLGGYGYAVIIDHGNGLSTLYAHNSDLAVSEGQNVSQGQIIAYAGSTGYSTGPHIHFEVRVNGEPVDPMGYL